MAALWSRREYDGTIPRPPKETQASGVTLTHRGRARDAGRADPRPARGPRLRSSWPRSRLPRLLSRPRRPHAQPSRHRGKRGDAVLYCHAGCPVEDVVAALGLELRDLFRNRVAYRQRRRKGVERDFYVVTVNGEHVPPPAKSCDGARVPADLPPAHRKVLDC